MSPTIGRIVIILVLIAGEQAGVPRPAIVTGADGDVVDVTVFGGRNNGAEVQNIPHMDSQAGCEMRDGFVWHWPVIAKPASPAAPPPVAPPTPPAQASTVREGDLSALAQRMFAAYNAKAGGKTWDGKPIPPWAEVGEKVRENWIAAAGAALQFAALESGSAAEPVLDADGTLIARAGAADIERPHPL